MYSYYFTEKNYMQIKIDKHFEDLHHQVLETRNTCFASKIHNTVFNQTKINKHEC